MSNLDNTLLRTILAEIFFAEEDRAEAIAYIVPKQGNWYNPQDTEEGKIATWIAYNIPNRETVLKARNVQNEVYEDFNLINELVEIDLQFVGTEAERLASSVMHWPRRADVSAAFEVVSGQVREDRIRVTSSWFKQEGMNTTYAYNVKVRVYCANLQETGVLKLEHFYTNGIIS